MYTSNMPSAGKPPGKGLQRLNVPFFAAIGHRNFIGHCGSLQKSTVSYSVRYVVDKKAGR